ncbi:hypothetical protein [Bacillus thuringiensis]|uniref:hypothetical protein n=1 Tax=Bacillus thuringiensis TaxID=1428 RepID=UPI003F6D450A
MPYLEDHGIGAAGSKGIELIPKGYSTPKLVGQGTFIAYRLGVGQTVAYLRRDYNLCDSIDIATGTKIATTTTVNFPYILCDENDDLIYNCAHTNGTRFAAYDKRFAKVWECTELANFNGSALLTKDYIFANYDKGVVKIDRRTGAVITKKDIVDRLNVDKGVWGCNENQNQIVFMNSIGISIILNANDLSVIKQFDTSELFVTGSEFMYGIGILNGILHVFQRGLSGTKINHSGFDLTQTSFGLRDRLFNYFMPGFMKQDETLQQTVQTYNKSIVVTATGMLHIIQYKNGVMKNTSLADSKNYYLQANKRLYLNFDGMDKLTHYGKIIQ